MGATRAMMHYENILAQRSLRENVLRATNCDHNNTIRQLNASQRQISMIQTLQENGFYHMLPGEVQVIADLRLQHPESSLEEIGAMLSPPLGKSGVNHRFRKISQLYSETNKSQGEKEHADNQHPAE